MNFLIALAVGIVGGLLGFTPFLVARSRIRSRLKKDGFGGIITGMAAIIISFLIMVAEIANCYFAARDYLLPFSISVITIFLLTISVYTVTLIRR